ncbi:MAG: DNA polymerase III subunit delta [Firmicutes bacterium]|nr:DNA polymerase III subunit delta [Bacillota bacterium]
MKFAELKKHLKDGTLLPAYLVTGDDAFVCRAAVGHFLNAFSVMAELNVSIFSSPQDAAPVLDACETLPVLAPSRLVLCHDYGGDGAAFLNYLAHPNPSAVLVFVCEKAGENFAKITAKLEIVDCNRLSDEQIVRWIKAKLFETNTSISDAAAHTLISFMHGDLTRISGEAERLGVYRLAAEVTKEDIERLVTPDVEYKIFDLSDAVSKKDRTRAAAVLKNLTDSGVPEVNILGMLYAHFRRLLYCAVNPKDPELAKKLGVKEYAVKVALNQIRGFPVRRLKSICDGFHTTDFAIKSGEIGMRLGLEAYVLGIMANE